MNRWRKVFLWITGLVASLALFGFFFLFYDNPYPRTDPEGLLLVSGTSLKKGKSPDVESDTGKNIVADGIWFKDPTGRIMIHHGINVSGSAKLPFTPRIGSHEPNDFYESASTCSF